MLGSPVIAVLAASMVFVNDLTPPMILGGIVAMTGVAIISIKSARKPSPPVSP